VAKIKNSAEPLTLKTFKKLHMLYFQVPDYSYSIFSQKINNSNQKVLSCKKKQCDAKDFKSKTSHIKTGN